MTQTIDNDLSDVYVSIVGDEAFFSFDYDGRSELDRFKLYCELQERLIAQGYRLENADMLGPHSIKGTVTKIQTV